MRICLMVEGQEDVGWDAWVELVRTAEEQGFEALFRSDHYRSTAGQPGRGALDAWASVSAMAALTETIRLGTLVSPATFRHPSVLARTVVTADHVSGGRVELGMGAGWLETEHTAAGFGFPDVSTRMEMLEEQVEIVVRQWTEERFDFHGRHYELVDCDALPEPLQRPHPNLIIGGSAGPRSAAIAARWAGEYNTVFASPHECRQRRTAVERAFEEAGRDPGGLTFSVMTGLVVGDDDAAVREYARRLLTRAGADMSVDEYLDKRSSTHVIGTPEAIVARLAEFSDAGVDRIMLQHLNHDDVASLRLIGEQVIPQFT